MNLFENDSDSDDSLKLKTNKDYAKTFHLQKEREFLQKFKDKKVKDLENSDESETSSSEDDEDAANPEFDKEFFKTLATLKRKDPKIFDKNTKFFQDIDINNKLSNNKINKNEFNIQKYETKLLMETNGKIDEILSEEDETKEHKRSSSPTFVEEEKQIKNEFKKVLDSDNGESDGEDNWGNLFKKKEKSQNEIKEEENQYEKWLSGQKVDIGEDAKELKPLKDYWSSDGLSKNEKFLRDYILNNGYVDEEEEIEADEDVKISEDEEEVEKQEEFEQKYNFRYEEPDQEFIKRYPRTIENSVRATDDKRKRKRQERKERKEKEKEQKLQELQVLKSLKKKEIEEKIQKLKDVTGNEDLPFDNIDLDGDFDPNEHDKRMKELFDDEYYKNDEGDQKPECPAYIEELQIVNWDNYNPNTDDNIPDDDLHCEDDDFNMDADYDPEAEKQKLQDELIDGTKKKRRKRKSKFAEVLTKEKPVFNPEDEKKYSEYIDEYYKLDYEDMIGDIPCRFKYVETVPNDFGLSVEEILLAKNSELNQWASLKKAVQIRPDHIEKNEVNTFKKKSQNLDLKKKIFKSIYGEDETDNENSDEEPKTETKPTNTDSENQKKKKKKKKKKSISTEESSNSTSINKQEENIVKDSKEKPNLKRKLENSETSEQIVKKSKSNSKNKFKNKKLENNEISDERLRAFGIQPSKYRFKQKLKSKNQSNQNKFNKKKKIK